VETTEYQPRIQGLNGTALVLPLSAPWVMNRVNAMYWFSRGEPGNYRACLSLLTISWNVRAPETHGGYAHSLSLITVLLPVAGLKIR